jgi:hypothetical protein
MTCTETQAKIARGETLDDLERDHALTCSDCAILVALASTLDALDPGVPAGFADRVMARITAEGRSAHEPPTPPRWYEGRWASVVLAAAAAVVAVLNAARFVASVLIPGGSFGGAP